MRFVLLYKYEYNTEIFHKTCYNCFFVKFLSFLMIDFERNEEFISFTTNKLQN